MSKFKIPNWLIFTCVFLNVFMFLFSLEGGDKSGAILSIICICCFIFTYAVNKREQDEKEEIKKEDD